jgi:hypothetical protein
VVTVEGTEMKLRGALNQFGPDKEPFSEQKLIGFALVWVAVSVFATEGIAANRRRSVASAAPSL